VKIAGLPFWLACIGFASQLLLLTGITVRFAAHSQPSIRIACTTTMMKMSLTFLLCLVAVAASTVVEATDSLELRGLQSNDEIEVRGCKVSAFCVVCFWGVEWGRIVERCYCSRVPRLKWPVAGAPRNTRPRVFSQLLLFPQQPCHTKPIINKQRELQVPVDFFFPEDVCENENGQFGVCDQSRFPTCDSRSRICYNRRPMRDSFYADNRQPFFYIDYSLVFCYPASWSGCSSCSPGRYCTSEARCILDEQDYPCAQWI